MPLGVDAGIVSPFRKLLLALLLVSLTGSAFGAGTFASFSASTTNATTTFASGTLILSNSVNSATACASAATGVGGVTANNSGTCSALFNVSLSKPGATATVDLDLKNEGSIDASKLEMYWDGATAGLCSTTDGAGSYHGGGNLCSQLQIFVQEYTDATARTNNTTTGAFNCRYSGVIGAGTACDSSGTPKTLADLDDYYGNTATAGNRFDLGASSVVGTGVLKAGQTRFFRLKITFPLASDNTFQGRTTSWGLTFNIIQ
jgi:hypothetical protein